MLDSPIKIRITRLKDGELKLAECSGGYASAATATFLREQSPQLAQQIQNARALWLQIKGASGVDPSIDSIFEQFSAIRELCTRHDVETYVRPGGRGDNRFLTPIGAANEIMQELFPTLTPEYIQRAGRARSKRKNDSKPL